jgi:signal transduction histidine kinase
VSISSDSQATTAAPVRELQSERDRLRRLSHDVRTPLSTVLMHAQRLAGHADDEVRRRGDRIAASARRIEELIREALDGAG